MTLFLAAALQGIAPHAPPPPLAPAHPREARFAMCAALAASDPSAAHAEAARWSMAGGGWFARQCAGLAFTTQGCWIEAAAAFEAAGAAAEVGHDPRAATYWAQAGNAWLAAGNVEKARGALDRALLTGTLTGLQLGEARLDRARVMVAGGDLDAARTDLDIALTNASDDPLAWLLSATLARRMGSPLRARKDIDEALRRSPDDASVQLEAGNIAALAGDEARATEAWAAAARLAPSSQVGRNAVAALKQFDTAPATVAAPTKAAPIRAAASKPPEGR